MAPHVLLIGGHGKVAQHMTPMLLSRSWKVTSLIRDAAQEQTIRDLGKDQSGQLDVLVHSLEDVKSEDDAKKLIEETGACWVVWTAGAGGRGGAPATHAIDNVAAKAFISASVHTPLVTRFVMISYIGSRRNRPSWWSDATWAQSRNVNENVLPAYAKAKLAADEHLTALATTRTDFAAVCLRPGTLSEEAAGRVALGKMDRLQKVSREVVGQVTVELLAKEGEWDAAKCRWLDLLDGDEEVGEAVQRCLTDGVDCVEGEDVDVMRKEAKLA